MRQSQELGQRNRKRRDIRGQEGIEVTIEDETQSGYLKDKSNLKKTMGFVL
jgi:hypothetical protein